MSAGEYTFGAGKPEGMTVVSSALKVLLPGRTGLQWFEAGQVFNVPGNSEFYLQVAEESAYLCRYL